MIYLHTSTLVRYAAGGENPLPALLAETEDGMVVCSALSRTELAAAPLPAEVLCRAYSVLRSPAVLDVEVSDLVRELAESRPEETLDAVQAVHLATALSLGAAITAFACDDAVLGAAASASGLRIVVPPFGSLA